MVQVIIRSAGAGAKYDGRVPLTLNGKLTYFPVDEEFAATSDEILALEDGGVIVERVPGTDGFDTGDAITVNGHPATITVTDGVATATLDEDYAVVQDSTTVEGYVFEVADGEIVSITPE